ncbi:GNAT family N-acetyltransferase [Chelativorans salis]|uniref:GNAT family N-acetyltransferase n=1 Tax=Chelativorans salis TaxID=2978478 RepID=A0ABT2LVT1_9HYPH|nr:GNAT family N-acetyltransferase [Chelativorans sp. EGI FJ00035]MCT7378624.1 GNAT family N-acetyltransferase [Chelativorans sp. EGI FJ00035]
MQITVRPYHSADVQDTAEIFLGAITEVSSRDYTPKQIAAWAKVDDQGAWGRARESRPTWIAEVDGQAVGFADLTNDGLLDMMFVHPQFQGVGVASSLLDKVEAQARVAGMSRIFTEASKTAWPFFEKRGFRVVRAQQVEKRGETLENFLMEKSLTR